MGNPNDACEAHGAIGCLVCLKWFGTDGQHVKFTCCDEHCEICAPEAMKLDRNRCKEHCGCDG
jgi:hypothetical protein